jgi:hypothetical protein
MKRCKYYECKPSHRYREGNNICDTPIEAALERLTIFCATKIYAPYLVCYLDKRQILLVSWLGAASDAFFS